MPRGRTSDDRTRCPPISRRVSLRSIISLMPGAFEQAHRSGYYDTSLPPILKTTLSAARITAFAYCQPARGVSPPPDARLSHAHSTLVDAITHTPISRRRRHSAMHIFSVQAIGARATQISSHATSQRGGLAAIKARASIATRKPAI